MATRAATPRQAIVMASVFNLLGPLLLGAAVADTIGGTAARRCERPGQVQRRRTW